METATPTTTPDTRPLGATFGAVSSGMCMAGNIDDDLVEIFRNALHRFRVLLPRDLPAILPRR